MRVQSRSHSGKGRLDKNIERKAEDLRGREGRTSEHTKGTKQGFESSKERGGIWREVEECDE